MIDFLSFINKELILFTSVYVVVVLVINSIWLHPKGLAPRKEWIIELFWQCWVVRLRIIYIIFALVISGYLFKIFIELSGQFFNITDLKPEEVRNLAIAFIGTTSGLGALFGIYLAILRAEENKRQNDVAEKQSDTAIEQSKAANEQSRAANKQSEAANRQAITAEDGLITERLSKATEGLGKNDGGEPVIEVRLGALYSLERIAQDSLRDHVQIMEMVCAYIRYNSPRSDTEIKTALELGIDKSSSNNKTLREDIKAAITIIGRREYWTADKKHLKVEQKQGYTIDLSHCNLQGAQLDLANLNGAQLEGADLSNAQLEEADLGSAQLNNANMSEARLIGADMNSTDLKFTNLSGAMLRNVDMSDAHLDNATLTRARLAGANMSNARIRNTNMSGVSLVTANLEGARIIRANLSGAGFYGAVTKHTCVYKGNFSELRRATQEQIDVMFCGIDVEIPTNLTRPKHWPKDDLSYSEFMDMYRKWVRKTQEPLSRRQEPLPLV